MFNVLQRRSVRSIAMPFLSVAIYTLKRLVESRASLNALGRTQAQRVESKGAPAAALLPIDREGEQYVAAHPAPLRIP